MSHRRIDARKASATAVLLLLLVLMLLVGAGLYQRDMLLHQALQLLLRDYGVTVQQVQGMQLGIHSARIESLQAVLPGATTPTRIDNLAVEFSLTDLWQGRVRHIEVESADLHPGQSTQTTMLPSAEAIASTLALLQRMTGFSVDIASLRISPWVLEGSFSADTDPRGFHVRWRAADMLLHWRGNWHDEAFVSSHFIPEDKLTERGTSPGAYTASLLLQHGEEQILQAEFSTHETDGDLLIDGTAQVSLGALSKTLQSAGIVGELAAGITGQAELRAQVTLPAARNAPAQIALALQPAHGTWTLPTSRLDWDIRALNIAGECPLLDTCRFSHGLAAALRAESAQGLHEVWPDLRWPDRAQPLELRMDSSGNIAWAGDEWRFDSPSLVVQLPRLQIDDQTLSVQLSLSALQASGRTAPLRLEYLDTALRLEDLQGLTLPYSLPVPALSTTLNWDGAQLHSSGALQITDALTLPGTLDFDTTTGRGRAQLQVPVIEFDADNARLSTMLQTTALPGDILAGSFSAQADLDLTRSPAGSLQVSGPIELLLQELSGFAGDTAISGLSTVWRGRLEGGALRSDDLAPLTIVSLDPGVPLQHLQASIAIDTGARVLSIAELSLEAFGGRVTSEGGEFSFDGPAGMLELQLQRIDVERILALGAYEGVLASGLLSGQLPVRLDANGITVSAGTLHAESPGGSIRYASAADSGNAAVDFVNTTLSNYRYDVLDASVDYHTDGELALAVQMQGVNPDHNPQQRINLNLNISDNIPSLLRSLQAGRSITDAIEANLQAR